LILYHGNENLKLNWNKVFRKIWHFFSKKLFSLFYKIMEFFFSNVWTGLTNLDLSRLLRLSFLIFLFLFLGMGTENIKFNSQILRREVCSRLFVVKKILGNRELLKGFVSLSVVCLFVSLSVCVFVFLLYLPYNLKSYYVIH
jgi:hypothetical protein